MGRGPQIVSFELAGSALRAQTIMNDWGEPGRIVAAFNLGFDYLFIPAYSTLMAFLCIRASSRFGLPWLSTMGIVIAWLQWLAGVFDCIEDAYLLKMLLQGPSDGAAQIARVSSLSKFGLLGMGLAYVIGEFLATTGSKCLHLSRRGTR